MTDVATRPVIQPAAGDGGHDRFAHYVRKDDAVRGVVDGVPIRALCGKVWVPSRDPDRYPVCPRCKELRSLLEQRGSN